MELDILNARAGVVLVQDGRDLIPSNSSSIASGDRVDDWFTHLGAHRLRMRGWTSARSDGTVCLDVMHTSGCGGRSALLRFLRRLNRPGQCSIRHFNPTLPFLRLRVECVLNSCSAPDMSRLN